MITLKQIKLRNLHKYTEADRRKFLEICGDPGAEQEAVLHDAFSMYGAFITVIFSSRPTDPSVVYKPSMLIAFKGFLNIEMGLSIAHATETLRSVCSLFSAWGLLTDDDIARALSEPQPICDKKYLSCDPSAKEIDIFNCLFRCNDPEKAVFVDLRELSSLMRATDITHFKGLLASYLNDKVHSQGEVDATVICSFMAGLLNLHPSVSLSDLHLSAKETREFVLSAKCASINEWLRAGHALESAWQSWGAAENVIYAFFEPNGFIALH